MKRKLIWAVFHTTENGADYAVKTGCKTHGEASDWEFENRYNFPRQLIIRKITY